MSDYIKQTVTSVQAAQQSYRDIVKMMEKHGYCLVNIKAGGRSLEQNNLFHMWCQEMSDGLIKQGRTKSTPDGVKIWMKAMFLGFEDIKYGNKILKDQLRHTSDLGPGAMFHFMEQMWQYAAQEHNIFLTIPEDSIYKKDRDKHEGIE